MHDIKRGQKRIHPGGNGYPDRLQLRQKEGIVLWGGRGFRGGLSCDIRVEARSCAIASICEHRSPGLPVDLLLRYLLPEGYPRWCVPESRELIKNYMVKKVGRGHDLPSPSDPIHGMVDGAEFIGVTVGLYGANPLGPVAAVPTGAQVF